MRGVKGVISNQSVCFIMGRRVARHGDKEMSGAKEGAELRLVTPGEAIRASSESEQEQVPLVMGDNIIATKVGWLKENNGVTSVEPIASAYMPRSGDLVLGIVESVRNNLWFADVNGPFNGLLPMSLAPWKVEFGAARQHMDIGDKYEWTIYISKPEVVSNTLYDS